jgi:hypothetical protein
MRWKCSGFLVFFVLAALACSPRVGSEAWCEEQKETPKADWSANDAADFAKHCVFK